MKSLKMMFVIGAMGVLLAGAPGFAQAPAAQPPATPPAAAAPKPPATAPPTVAPTSEPHATADAGSSPIMGPADAPPVANPAQSTLFPEQTIR